MLFGITLLILFQLAGELLSRGFGLPIPGPVMGMLLLAAWCLIQRGTDERVAKVAEGLLGYLGLLFVPAGVGLMALGPMLKANGLAIVAVVLVSLVVTLSVTGLLLKWLLARRK
ncbi:CidA/LrgA family protein [Andreprevotia chitinilytica]|uniref:CidA/LrgA family protein n=1 Tax=Andreprevotia chitinilytica TaxID=396808 RepID=UPI00054F4430|nr:CidA/LrgA family protein [Andreprevotia chitinilytica]